MMMMTMMMVTTMTSQRRPSLALYLAVRQCVCVRVVLSEHDVCSLTSPEQFKCETSQLVSDFLGGVINGRGPKGLLTRLDRPTTNQSKATCDVAPSDGLIGQTHPSSQQKL